ncbi:hypothetical protein J437_LFUL008876 [Ladona fulva]|uniref:tRNA pseudouridine(55) synthase n=1 Tax=Ladona fulva TaxID=123851 RepID=A0A8K0KD86_LADFU|nr:hypothetical protein J437_LFUL008876 [Ladona fulva]
MALYSKFKDIFDQKDDADDHEVKKSKSNPCIGCLNLLLDSNDYEKICCEVEENGYDASSFTCALSLPVSLQIREKSMLLYLSHNFCKGQTNNYGFTQFVSLKDAWKWTYAPNIAERLNKKFDSGIDQDFFVEINVNYCDDEKECSCLLKMHPDIFVPRSKHPRKYGGEIYTRKAVDSVFQNTTYEQFQPFYPCPPEIPTNSAQYSQTTCYHNSIYVAGRYNKFSRVLSQTPWVIDGERRVESSVQELICTCLIRESKAQDAKFSASGREDVDVRTLGKGRPFAVELVNPHRVHLTPLELKALQDEINENSEGKIAVRDLQIVSKDELSELKDGEEGKGKRYAALCVALTHPAPGALESLPEKAKDLVLHQKTPIRVLHRRPLAERLRTIFDASAEALPSNSNGDERLYFKLKVRTQAGTYVKEFVHGDFGRTQPNLGSLLGVEVDILALDVEEVELDWPKEVHYG